MAAYEVVQLPKLPHYDLNDPVTHALATKFRALRLYALQTDPDAFGSNYHDEEARHLSSTVERLAHPPADAFVAITKEATSEDGAAEDVLGRALHSTWMGMMVQICRPGPLSGPMAGPPHAASAHASTSMYAAQDASGDDAEVFNFHLAGTFVHPDARGHGLGRALLEAAFAEAERKGREAAKRVVMHVVVNKKNPAACRLYESGGFKVVGDQPYVRLDWSRGTAVEVHCNAWKMERLLWDGPPS